MTDMIEDIVKTIEKTWKTKVEVDYDFMPVDAEDVLESINILLDDETDGWVASGELFGLYSISAGKEHISIILLKRGVELHFELPS